MNEMLGDLKKKLMNDDMWEAFDTIVYLVGKFVEYISILFFIIYVVWITKNFRKCEKTILKKTKDLIKMKADDKEEDLYVGKDALFGLQNFLGDKDLGNMH